MRILFLLGILFSHCLNAQESFKVKLKKAPKEEYILKKDSSKIVGKVNLRSDKIFLDDKGYELSELIGYKKGNDYHAIFGNSIYWVWALGKIQAYSEWRTLQKYVVFDKKKPDPITYVEKRSSFCYLRKDSGNLIMYTTQTLFDLIKDNEEAVKEFNSLYSKINNTVPVDMLYNKLTKVLTIYNGGKKMEY